MPAEPAATLIDIWNAAVAQLKAYLGEAVTLAESDPYAKYEFVKGYRAAMSQVLKLVEEMHISPQDPQPEEIH